jgi:Protein of unknown function (DUF1573)
MRLLGVILVSAVVGSAIGGAWAYIDVRPGASVDSHPSRPAGNDSRSVGSDPVFEVDEPVYQFGAMQRGTTKSHEFVVHNVGKSPLTLRTGGTTCKCTIGDVPEEPVPPGGSVKVKLEWSALINPGPFRQTATILTNDPHAPRVELSVEGEVTEATGLMPSDFMFDKVPAGDTKSADVYIMAFAQDNLTVSDPELTNIETRKFFDVTIEPLKPSELPNRQAKSGVRVRVSTKPGLRMGRFDQWLAVSTNIPDAEKIKIPIIGRVIGDISIHGRMWNEDQGVLRLGRVVSAEGASAPLNIVIRGANADQVKLSVGSVDPPQLIAKLGEPRHVKQDLVHVPLTIELPPGMPPMARLDIDQHDEARVILKTNRPEMPEIVLGVRFAVEN